MSDSGNEIQEDRKTPSVDDRKENLAIGKGIPEPVSIDQFKLIPDQTPGREVSIRPRSPFRDINRAESKKSSSTRSTFTRQGYSPDESVKVYDTDVQSTVRSVYEIGRPNESSHHVSIFNSQTSPNLTNPQHLAVIESGQQGAPGYLPPPPPGYSYYPPPLYPVIPPPHQPDIPEYDKMSASEQQEARIIFRSKFASLRDNYPEMSFDDYDPELPLSIIHKIYEQHLKKISIDSNSSFTRTVLVLMFLGIEAFSIRVLGLDLTGYTRNQIASMKRYDRLLLELGEKYSGGGGNWPIEARLIMLAVFNAFLIIGVKFIGDKIGSTDTQWILDTVNNMVGGHIDSFVEKKPEPVRDPVTKTAEVPADTSRNLMGSVENLMALAGQTLGSNKGNTDLATTIGNIGSKFMPKLDKADKAVRSKDPDSVVASGKSKRGVRFGKK